MGLTKKTILKLSEQTDQFLKGAKILDSYFQMPKGIKTENIEDSKFKNLSERLEAMDKQVNDIQFLVDSGDTLTSIAEVVALITQADANLQQTITDLGDGIKDEVAFSQNTSVGFQDLLNVYNQLSSNYDRFQLRTSQIKSIIQSGVDPDTGLPLTQEQIDSLNAENEKLVAFLKESRKYYPFNTFSSFYTFYSDVNDNKLTSINDRLTFVSNFQPLKVVNVTLTSDDILAGYVSTKPFIGDVISAVLSGVYQHEVASYGERNEFGYFTNVSVPYNAVEGDILTVVALSQFDGGYPKSKGDLASPATEAAVSSDRLNVVNRG